MHIASSSHFYLEYIAHLYNNEFSVAIYADELIKHIANRICWINTELDLFSP